MFRCACLAALSVWACDRSRGVSDQELNNLVVADKPAPSGVDVARAAQDPDELGRALARPYAAELAALGPHGVAIATRTTVTENGAQVSELSDTATLEVAGGSDASWHGTYTNSADYGRETIFASGGSGKQLYLRPRYQRWHGRAPETPEEPVRLRDGYPEAIAATWDLLAPRQRADRRRRCVRRRAHRPQGRRPPRAVAAHARARAARTARMARAPHRHGGRRRGRARRRHRRAAERAADRHRRLPARRPQLRDEGGGDAHGRARRRDDRRPADRGGGGDARARPRGRRPRLPAAGHRATAAQERRRRQARPALR